MNAVVCLALAIYFEARGEPLAGQIAVGQVVMARVDSDRFPETVCGVVTQYKQFSFVQDGTPDIPLDAASWQRSRAIAKLLIDRVPGVPDYSQGALHYTKIGVKRVWMHEMPVCHQIGKHIFYKE